MALALPSKSAKLELLLGLEVNASTSNVKEHKSAKESKACLSNFILESVDKNAKGV